MRTLRASFFVIILFAFAPQSHAAELSVFASNQPLLGETLRIALILNTKGEALNALEGVLVYPKEQLRLTDIRSGNSVVTFWVESPEDTDSGIRFAGIVPGGYRGERGEVLLLEFDVLSESELRFQLNEARALAHDGVGTPLSVSLAPKVLLEPHTSPSGFENGLDTIPPEPFEVTRTASPDLFDGQEVLIFATQDKQTGVQRYEISESLFFPYPQFLLRFVDFSSIRSPHVLTQEQKEGYLFIRALDAEGNQRLVFLSPNESIMEPWHYRVLAILVLLALSGAFYIRHARRKK